jgi:hypothetical protein
LRAAALTVRIPAPKHALKRLRELVRQDRTVFD